MVQIKKRTLRNNQLKALGRGDGQPRAPVRRINRLSHAGQTEISRRAVVLSKFCRRLSVGDTIILEWRLSPRGTRRGLDCQKFRRRWDLRCGDQHERRRHVGRRCRRGGEDLCRIREMGLWQTDPLGGDYWLRTFFQRCVCNEQQRNQRRTHDRKIDEDMHNRAPTVQAPQQL